MPRCTAYPSILGTIGSTPLVLLRRIMPREYAQVLVKLEFFNPLSSVKDRIGLAMVEAAERDGVLGPDSHIVEPTSGNTGIALAMVAAAKGYRVTLTMPESMSHERRAMLRGLNADLVLTPASLGMKGAVQRAHEIVEHDRQAWMPHQFENPANPAIHEETTGPEIWADTAGKVDVLIAGVGTGGTITGTTRYLRKKNPKLISIAVEPEESAILSGGVPRPHRIQGIGTGFVPVNLDTGLLTDVETVTSEEAFKWARRLAQEEGIPAGISSGANVAVAARLAARPEYEGKTIVTFAPSSAERYLTTSLYELVGAHELDENEIAI